MTHPQSLDALLDQTGWIQALARRLVADPNLAADLAQDTCVDALDAEPDATRSLRGWLATVMRNHVSKLHRSETNRTRREQRASRDEAQASAHDVVEKAETHRNVVLAVLALEEPYRSTLLMRYFEDLSYEEIAKRTGVTRASVNSRITRGLERLRGRLETTYGGDRRALSLALIPLATLPRVASTLFGVKTMHLAIGTTVLALAAVTVSVSLLSKTHDVEVSQTASLDAGAMEFATGARAAPAAPVLDSTELQVAQAPATERDAVEPALVAAAPESPAAAPARDVWKTEVSRSLSLAPDVGRVGVDASNGDIELSDSPGGTLEILAKVHAEVGVVADRERTSIFETHVEVIEDKGSVRILDRHRDDKGWTVSFVVRVPASAVAVLNSGSGDVVVHRAQGRAVINTGSGDVSVRVAERIQKFSATTGSGDIEIGATAVDESLQLNAGSGDLVLHLVSGDSAGTVKLNSGSGDVRLALPADVIGSFDLETNGDSLELPPQLGIQVKDDGSGRKTARGAVGSGGGTYVLRSGSGDLSVAVGGMMKRRSAK